MRILFFADYLVVVVGWVNIHVASDIQGCGFGLLMVSLIASSGNEARLQYLKILLQSATAGRLLLYCICFYL